VTDIDMQIFDMAFIAVRKQIEKRNKAMNCFLEDISKMSMAQYNACMFFKELWKVLESLHDTRTTIRKVRHGR